MMIRLAAALILIALPASAAQQRFIVCPSHLDYCYYETKPILPQMKGDDAVAAAREIIRRQEERIEQQDRQFWRNFRIGR